MGNKRLIYLILLALIIWLTALTFANLDKEKNNSTTNINEYDVSGFSTDFTKIVENNKSSIVTNFVTLIVSPCIYILYKYYILFL